MPWCPEADDGEIDLEVSGGTAPYDFLWNNGSTSSALFNLTPGNYGVIVTDANDCEQSESIELGYQNENCLFVPGIITPNGDGKNDTWEIKGLEFYPGAEVEIYNRWGKRIFFSREYDNPWDGTYNGKELPMESYHYVIQLNNGSKPIIGNITVVR